MDLYRGNALSTSALGPRFNLAILGGLIVVSGYDLLRNVLPPRFLLRVWIYEHLYKMMSAYIAITSAFASTVFARYMPWAAILPSVVGFIVIAGFFVAGPRAWRHQRTSVSIPANFSPDIT